MWNSPHSPSPSGKRYALADLTALILPLDELLYLSEASPVSELVEEAILQRLERSELVFALYKVFEALTGDAPVPKGGHFGIHEAIIADLLRQSFDRVVCEMEMGDVGESARQAVWQSVDRLLIQRNPDEPALPRILEDAGMTLEDPESYRLEKITLEHWEELLCGEDFLFDEFLHYDDWRMDFLMDLPTDTAKRLTDLAGLNLKVVQALPHTPSEDEVRMAEGYLKGLIGQLESEDQDRWRGEVELGREAWPDTPF